MMKFKNTNYCVELKAPLQHQELVLQKQPTSIKDPDCSGHFYHNVNAWKKLSCKPTAFTDLSHLPSHKGRDNATASDWDKKLKRNSNSEAGNQRKSKNKLEQQCLTGGYKCFPICIECHDEKKQ
eukprot:5687069-Ditylum_brightwellii.AAC.1